MPNKLVPRQVPGIGDQNGPPCGKPLIQRRRHRTNSREVHGIRPFSPIARRGDAGRSGPLSADSTSDPQWALLALSARPDATHPTVREPRSTIAMREQTTLTRPMLANARTAGSCVLPRSRFRPKGESNSSPGRSHPFSDRSAARERLGDQPRLRGDAVLGADGQQEPWPGPRLVAIGVVRSGGGRWRMRSSGPDCSKTRSSPIAGPRGRAPRSSSCLGKISAPPSRNWRPARFQRPVATGPA